MKSKVGSITLDGPPELHLPDEERTFVVKVRPCPWCGQKPLVQRQVDPKGIVFRVVHVKTECEFGKQHHGFPYMSEAIHTWNLSCALAS